MDGPRFDLTITLLPNEAELVQKVARFRLGRFDGQGDVDLGAYIRGLIDRDVDSCVKEIERRQRA